ncbi:30S ribosomal protein S17 [Neoconidiobolus thromboides FSU 785]|nr:30S ribosomal protein S17 [Neoconidiobolus thromboides FSU 785]
MKQNLIGLVVSTAAQKTIKVCVPRVKLHRIVKKEMVVHKNYAVHDELEKCQLGDVVRIQACRPISKTKAFAVAEIVKKAETYTDPESGEVLR